MQKGTCAKNAGTDSNQVKQQRSYCLSETATPEGSLPALW